MARTFSVRQALAQLTAGFLLSLLINASVRGEDLLEIYHKAQLNDPTFEAARYELEANREKIPQALAGLLPVLSVSGSDNLNRLNTVFSTTPTVPRDIRSWNWTLQLTQPLVRAQNFYAYSESESIVEQAIAQYAKAEQDLILRVAQPYFDVLVAQESIPVANAQVSAMEEQFKIAKLGFDAGTHAITDVYEAKSKIDLARSERVAAFNALDIKRAELEKVIGEMPKALSALKPDLVSPTLEPNDPQIWINQARENNPAVRVPKAALEAAEVEVKRNLAEYLPTVDAIASYGGSFSSGSVYPSDYSTISKTQQVGLQLNMPLFSGGATNSRVNEAIANKYKANANLEVARREAAHDARLAFTGIVNGLSQIEALSSAVESSRNAVQASQTGYKLGANANIDVLNSDHQLYTAQRDLVQARYDTLLQGLKLKAAAGVLTEADLITINAFLAKSEPP